MNSPNDADYYELASEYERVCDELDAIKRKLHALNRKPLEVRSCLTQAIDDLENMFGTPEREVLDGLNVILREWIDPQRIVELAKRYTDEGKAGWLELVFRDANPDMWLCWSINTPNWEAEYEGESAAEVLKEAEA